MSITSSYACQMCGGWVTHNMPHVCQWTIPSPTVPPAPFPTQPMYPAYPVYPGYPGYQPIPPTITLEDIRRIVREELDRKPDSPGAPE